MVVLRRTGEAVCTKVGGAGARRWPDDDDDGGWDARRAQRCRGRWRGAGRTSRKRTDVPPMKKRKGDGPGQRGR